MTALTCNEETKTKVPVVIQQDKEEQPSPVPLRSFCLCKKPEDLSLRRCQQIVKYVRKRLRKEDNEENDNGKENSTVITHSQIKLGEKLGRGSFSSVYEIQSINDQETQAPMAIKFLRSTLYDDHALFATSAADLIKEGNILSTLNHPNVIGLRGVSSARGVDTYLNGYHDAFFLVLERLESTLNYRIREWKARHKEVYEDEEMYYNGKYRNIEKTAKGGHPGTHGGMNKILKKLSNNLTSLFSSYQRVSDSKISTTSDPINSGSEHEDTTLIMTAENSRKLKFESFRIELLDERINVTLQLANALAYLHRQNILHRDLKPDNIGFDRNGVLKVFDFDIARVAPSTSTSTTKQKNENEDQMFHMTQNVGTPLYMSPECALEKPYNKKADVYSYGLLFHQIITLEKPYGDIKEDQHKKCVFYENVRPHITDMQLPERVKELIRNTWSANIQHRPTMKTVQKILKKEQTEILRLGMETDVNSSMEFMFGERNDTSYVTSCAFKSMSDNNPKYKNMIKAMMTKNNKKAAILNTNITQHGLFRRLAKAT